MICSHESQHFRKRQLHSALSLLLSLTLTRPCFDQDELAWTQTASPGYAGTNYELDFDTEIDPYGYWVDLEYGDDPYLDTGVPKRRSGQQFGEAGLKRKHTSGKFEGGSSKKRRIATTEDPRWPIQDGDLLVFQTKEERTRHFERRPPILETRTKYAFLPDWRTRFESHDGKFTPKKMPPDMKWAAEGRDPETPSKSVSLGRIESLSLEEQHGDEEWEDEEAGADGEMDLSALDPEMLKAVLKQKLGDAGLEGMDESGFMQAITKMLSGDGDADTAMGDLASSLLDKATQDEGDGALSGWLTQQGVSVDAEGDASEAGHGETAKEFASSARSREDMLESPGDSAISVADVRKPTETAQESQRSKANPASTKRKLGFISDGDMEKKKKIALDPTTRSSSGHLHDTNYQQPGFATDEHIVASEEKPTSVPNNRNEADDLAAMEKQVEGSPAAGSKRNQSSPGQNLTESQPGQVVEKAPAKNTRKRKNSNAETTGHDTKQSSIAPEPPAKRTRAARARAKK